MRALLVSIASLLLFAGCSTASTSSSPYLQPDGSDVASIRFRVANVGRPVLPRLGAVKLFNHADEQCNESAQGRYIDEIGTNKAFVSRTNQSIGMPKPTEYPAYQYVERRFVANKPIVFSVIVASDGPQTICQQTYKLVPKAGQMYEVVIDVLDLNNCPAQANQLRPNGGTVENIRETSFVALARSCPAPAFLN